MGLSGYAGRILYVNLTDGSSRVEPLDEKLAASLIGGFGINNRLALDHQPAGVDPLSPENLIIIGTGPFAGTAIPGAAKVLATTRFPLNEAFGTAAAGGSFAGFLKSSGFDHVVISGRSSRPVVLRITEQQVHLDDAGDLWGGDTYETTDALHREHEPCSVIAIGQAGENLVKNSIAMVDKAGTLGRGGLPAVMGSKQLKAIVACQGTIAVEVADRQELHRLVNHLHDRILKWPGRQGIVENGLMVAPPDMAEYHLRTRKPLACPSCPLGDKVMVRLDKGPYAGLQTYMTHLAVNRFSAQTSDEAYEQSIKYSDTLNRYGVGGTNFTGLFAEVIQMYRQGVITAADTGGLELRNDIDTALELLRMTAFREGFGEVLADGAEGVIKRFGPEAEKFVSHIKGLGVVNDPRIGGLGTMEFEQLTSPRGAHVAAAGSPSYDAGRPLADFVRHGQRMGASAESLERLEASGAFNPARYSRYSEDWYALFNGLSLCNRAQVNRFYHVDTLVELYQAVTGMKAGSTELMQAAERAWTIGKMLNMREGFDRRQDRIPETWFQSLTFDGHEQAITDYYRTTELTRQDLDGLLDDYYDERGYDKATGLPTQEKLRELGLAELGGNLP